MSATVDDSELEAEKDSQNGEVTTSNRNERLAMNPVPVVGTTDSEPDHAEEITWLLVGSGIVAALTLLLRRRQRTVDWLIPVGLIGAGIIFLLLRAKTLLQRREARMETARQVILAELDALDPIARAQVIKAVLESEVPILTSDN